VEAPMRQSVPMLAKVRVIPLVRTMVVASALASLAGCEHRVKSDDAGLRSDAGAHNDAGTRSEGSAKGAGGAAGIGDGGANLDDCTALEEQARNATDESCDADSDCLATSVSCLPCSYVLAKSSVAKVVAVCEVFDAQDCRKRVTWPASCPGSSEPFALRCVAGACRGVPCTASATDPATCADSSLPDFSGDGGT